jgi:Flp pilus assembly protein TadD
LKRQKLRPPLESSTWIEGVKRTNFTIVALLGACLLPPLLAQSPSVQPEEEHPSERVGDLSELELDPAHRLELEDAMKLRDFRRAEKILVEESEHDPKSLRSAKLLAMAGGVFFLDGQYLESVIAWQRAEAISPLDHRSRFTMAMAYVRLNRRDWARAELEKLRTAQPQNPLYLYWLARLDYDAQNYTTAVARLKKAIALDPKMMRAYDSLGLCYEYLGQSDEAIKSYNRAVELNRQQPKPSPWPHVDLAVTLISVNQLAEAEKSVRDALGYDPRLPQAHYQLGRVLEMRGDYQAAVEALRQAATLDPAYPEPHLLLGRICHRLGESKQGEAEIEQYQRLKKAAENQSALKLPSR